MPRITGKITLGYSHQIPGRDHNRATVFFDGEGRQK
jgi:hypothetical protein